MIVAVQKGLNHMSESLRNMGFDTVVYGEYKYPVDAIVTQGVNTNLMMSADTFGMSEVLLVDCRGKSPSEVADILRRRLYTPLF